VGCVAWGWIHGWFEEEELPRQMQVLWICGIIFLTVYVVDWVMALQLNWLGNPSKAYWDQLAMAFLKGELFLENPSSTHDLTFFQGHWYVPNPPMPAFLMMLPMKIAGPKYLSVVRFSMLISAANAVLMFLLLERAARKQWFSLSRFGILLLIALFAFGTPMWWVGFNGRMWYLSQTVTVLFLLLAAFSVLEMKTAWLGGLFLGCAILARPNVAVIGILLLGMVVQNLSRAGRKLLAGALWKWILVSGGWILLSIAVLLGYNHLRFGNLLDFGYVTINGDPRIVEAVKTYGMFHPHFIPLNLRVMFLEGVSIQPDWPFFSPHKIGMSMLWTSPALIFLVKKRRAMLWTAGGWGAVILSILFLAMYHNTGADQFGYRYLLDFIIPLWLLLAAGLGPKPSRWFIGLVVISILVNLYGTIWIYTH
jgi:hypothetical protein